MTQHTFPGNESIRRGYTELHDLAHAIRDLLMGAHDRAETDLHRLADAIREILIHDTDLVNRNTRSDCGTPHSCCGTCAA
jgi:hypothetical protein